MRKYMFLLTFLAVPALADDGQEDRWPGGSTIGVRAGFGGGTTTPGITAGNVGIKVLLNDQFGLVADLGMGITSTGGASVAEFAVDAGLNIYLLSKARALRPYVPVFLGFGVVNGGAGLPSTGTTYGGSVFQMALGAGFGAEYFFSKQFSVSADLVLRIHFLNFNPVTVNIATLTPGIHAAWYF